MTGLQAEYGGCIYVWVDPVYRELKMYNRETYSFSNIRLSDCYALNDGGGFFVGNVRSMKVHGGSDIRESEARNAGGGVFFDCDRTVEI